MSPGGERPERAGSPQGGSRRTPTPGDPPRVLSVRGGKRGRQSPIVVAWPSRAATGRGAIIRPPTRGKPAVGLTYRQDLPNVKADAARIFPACPTTCEEGTR